MKKKNDKIKMSVQTSSACGPMNNFQTFHSEIDVLHVLSVASGMLQKGYGHPEDSWDVLE